MHPLTLYCIAAALEHIAMPAGVLELYAGAWETPKKQTAILRRLLRRVVVRADGRLKRREFVVEGWELRETPGATVARGTPSTACSTTASR